MCVGYEAYFFQKCNLRDRETLKGERLKIIIKITFLNNQSLITALYILFVNALPFSDRIFEL